MQSSPTSWPTGAEKPPLRKKMLFFPNCESVGQATMATTMTAEMASSSLEKQPGERQLLAGMTWTVDAGSEGVLAGELAFRAASLRSKAASLRAAAR